MAVVFNLLATQVPPPVVPGAFYPPRISTPLNSPYIPSGSTPDVLLPLAKEYANRLDMTARYGSPGGYGILEGLGLLDYTTNGIPVTAGVVSLDGLAFLLALPGTDARVTPGNPSNIGGFAVVSDGTAINNYLYVTSAQGVIAFVKAVGSLTPPAGAVGYLGRVQMNSGVGTIDGSGVFTRRFGGGWERTTADPGLPGDTPPAGVRFINHSLLADYLWDGAAYRLQQRWEVVSPAQITADQNNYALSAAAGVFRLSTDAARTVTGFTNGVDGRRVQIFNVGAQNLIVANQSASSTAANRVITGTGASVTIAADGAARLVYDGTTARWRFA